MKQDYRWLIKYVDEARVFFDEPMKKHTSFRIGGPADALVAVASAEEIALLTQQAKKRGVPFFVMGNGSNLLVLDGGVRALVMKTSGAMDDISFMGHRVIAKAGANLALLSRKAAEAGLTGLEFACGIPGSVGGAVAMNAGAYGGEIKDVLESILVLEDGRAFRMGADTLGLGYRSSILKDSDMIVLEAVFALSPGEAGACLGEMQQLLARRCAKQPVQQYSAGSTFKRPKNGYASALIDAAGLKGTRVGGAMVSDKHAGFIVNTGGATARDVISLMELVEKRVFEQFGVVLEPEVKIWGEEIGETVK